MEETWDVVKSDLKERISPSGFSLWIEPLQVDRGPQGELQLICPNPFALRWVMSHYLPHIHQALAQMGQSLPVKLLAAPPKARTLAPAPAVEQLRLPLPGQGRKPGRSLNREFTLANSWWEAVTAWPTAPPRPWRAKTPFSTASYFSRPIQVWERATSPRRWAIACWRRRPRPR